jgi:hypothetical protein
MSPALRDEGLDQGSRGTCHEIWYRLGRRNRRSYPYQQSREVRMFIRNAFPFARVITSILSVMLIGVSGAHGQTCESPLTLPPNSQLFASTCTGESRSGSPQGIGDPKAILRFDLEEPSSVVFTLAGIDPGFTPIFCLEVGETECGTGECMAPDSQTTFLGELPAGRYRVIVSASPVDSPGSCGEFIIANETSQADHVFGDGFD